MILAIDVYYIERKAKVVGILFEWDDTHPQHTIITEVEKVEEYTSGQFYKRELPCILQLIQNIDITNIECIIVDGHVYVHNNLNLGLGGHLYHALQENVPIIGVAKKSFIDTEQVSFPIYRGTSKSPLYISTIGYDIEKAKQNIKTMYGDFRIPTLLKELDRITKI